MSNVRDFSPSAILAAEIEQFENAVELTFEHKYVNVNYEDDYYFGSTFCSGLNTLLSTHSEVGDDFTVMDVGYGNGTFLREVAARYPLSKRIGMSAVSLGELNDATVIAGDISRVDTWVSSTGLVPEAGSIDVAVSHLTFMHLANPIKGLANVLKLINPNGRLYLDHLRLDAEPTDFEALKDALHEVVSGHVQNPRISSTDTGYCTEVSLDFPLFRDGLDVIDLSVFKPYVNGSGDISFTI